MPRYSYDGQGLDLREYDQDFLSPDVPTRPLNRRRRQSKDERDEERPRLQRSYHSNNEGFSVQIADGRGDNARPLHRSASQRRRHRTSNQVEDEWGTAILVHSDHHYSRPQAPSPPRAFSRVEPPPLLHDYYPEVEELGVEIVDEQEGDQRLPHRSNGQRHEGRRIVTSPTQAYRRQVPSPPRVPSNLERPRVQRAYYSDNESLGLQNVNQWDSRLEAGTHRHRTSGKRVPSPPRLDSSGKKQVQAPRVPIVSEQRIPSPPILQRREDLQPPYDPVSLQGRASPPLPPTVISTTSKSPPVVQRTSVPIRIKSTAKVGSGHQASFRDSTRRELASSQSKEADPRCVRYRVPSPPPVNHRRHSDMDVPTTRLERPQIASKTASHRSGRSRVLSSPRDQASLAVPGSFPSLQDDVLPEDSRSETSPSGKRLSSGDARSLSSGSTLRQSALSSVSGVLGEHFYRYKPLDTFQFRLVRILPKTMSLVKCELVHYSVEDPPSYIAISYAWGDTDDKKTLQLEGADIPVSASLHGALFALRAKKESVLVWVDGLSIDQQNTDERTQQVQLMTHIYSRATSVAIWLGPEADDSNIAMQTLNEVKALDFAGRKSLIESKAGKSKISSVVALFEREYWSRLWPVQEVFNAQAITVYCGAMTLPWSVFRNASNAFWLHKSLIDKHFPGSFNHGGPRASSTQFTYSQVLVYHGPSSIPDNSSFGGLGEESLLEVMRLCRRKLSADPRDKLYGILGLLAEDIRNEFPVHYGISVKEVYVKVFDYLLCTTDQLDVLCEAVHFPLHTGSNLPSWVPDWSHNPETSALGRAYKFSAAGSTKAVARVLDDRKRLEISAIHVDTIRSHGISVGTLCTLADYVMAFIHWRAQLLSNTEDGETQARQEEFCKTLSLDQLPSEWENKSWRAACYHVFASMAHERIPRLPLDEELWQYVDANVGIEPNDRRRFLQEHFGSRMMGRCFCITEGGFMGMGSGFMAAGDTVVLPLGCPTPILLRPEGPRGEYRYVGDVYIHGYMNGEAVDDWKSGDLELHKYVLH